MDKQKGFIHAFKPGTSHRKQLGLAALMWSIVGAALFIRGITWAMEDGHPAWMVVSISILCIALGMIKGRLALDKAAQRASQRIVERGDGTCLFGFFSWKSWLLIILMIAMGRALRMSPLPRIAVGGIYVAIGTALSFSSRIFWQALFPRPL